mmetsp:Transcript_3203/g.7592  ORF Transcript_3203/g.7592 Transcript_3203/m.7592 type:complete len:449 (-) Transcript_3203:445-1791(-)
MLSSWGKRLEKKLNGLADTASKESIQTHSNWIAFNRKHVQTIATVLTKSLQDNKSNEKHQWLFWQIINEILVREKGNAKKWDKLGELRLALGEALQPAMKTLGSSMPDQLEAYLEEWEDQDVFGGPSLNAQIRWIYQHRNNVSTATTTQAAPPKTSAQAPDTTSTTSGAPQAQDPSTASVAETKLSLASKLPDESSGAPMELTEDDNSGDMLSGPNDDDAATATQQEAQSPSASIPSAQKQSAPLKEQTEFDFESKGVPPGPVESRDFSDPCTAITTLQIARDIRTNTAVETSTALENFPADIKTACEDLDSGKLSELDTATTNDFSIRIPSSLIDLDIDEEASNLNMFQDIVQRQQKAREKLIYMLLRSRCKFGSAEAAQEFYEIDELAKQLKTRKELLSDALELEGLDTNEIGNNSKTKKRDLEKELPALTWYTPDNGSNKKQKVA